MRYPVGIFGKATDAVVNLTRQWMEDASKEFNNVTVNQIQIPQNYILGRKSTGKGIPEQLSPIEVAVIVGGAGGGVASVFQKVGSVANIADAAGWLHNTALGVFSWSTPSASDVGADAIGVASGLMSAHLAASDPHPQYYNAARIAIWATTASIGGSSTSCTGNAATASSSPAGSLTGATLAANVLASSLTSVGTLAGLTVTAAIVGSVTGSSATCTGNAATATKSTNLIGGNNTTLLGSIPYQSNTDATMLLAPNVTTGQKFLAMTGDGTNGAAPGWVTAAVGSWVKVFDYTVSGTAVTSVLATGLDGNVAEVYQIQMFVIVAVGASFDIQLNADSGANYWYQYILGAGTGVSANRDGAYTRMLGTFAGTGDIAQATLTFYAKSGTMRIAKSQGDRGSGAAAQLMISNTGWNNTVDNITSMKFLASVANSIGIGSRFIIWKKA